MVTVITLRLNLQQVNEILVGFIHTMYYSGMLLGSIFVERQIKQIGYIRAFALFGALVATGFLLMGLVGGILPWVIIRFFHGYCLAGLYVTIEGWLLAASTVNTRGKILALYTICLYGSSSVGQIAVHFTDEISQIPFTIAGLISIIGIMPVLLIRQPVPEIHNTPPLKVTKYIRLAPLGLFGCFISGIVMGAILSFGPNFAQEAGLKPSVIMFSIIFGGLILQFPIGKVSDLFDRRKISFIIGLAILLPAITMMIFSDYKILIISSMVLGGLAFSLYPLAVAQVIDKHQGDSILPATSMALFSYGIGAVIGPISIAFLLKLLSYKIFLPFISLMFLLTSFSSVISLNRDKKVKIDEQARFVALPRVSPIANELDPRESPEEFESLHNN